ncbi:MAG: DUF58 domain-containing protein [Anaerolineales bacterium]
MSRNFLLILIIYVLLALGLASVHGELLGLALPFVAYLLVGLWRAPEKLQLEVERRLSLERAAPDQEVDVTVTVTNRGGNLEEVLLEDVVPPALTVREGTPRRLLSLKKGESYTWTYTVIGPRGAHPFEMLKAGASDHFGVRRSRLEIRERSELFIFPPLTRLKNVTIRPRRTRVYSGIIPARLGGPGVEFFGLREYQPGDAMRWINWRASARHRGMIYANEFQQERVSDVGIVLDGRAKANLFHGQYALFEHSVLAAAALADVFLSQGNRVSLLNYGLYLRWTLPGYGKIQRERLMQALARAEPGGSAVFEGLDHIPTQLFPSHSQLVLVSPLLAGDLDVLVRMRARGYQVMVISPDPVSFELSYLPDTPDVRLAGRVLRMERNLLLKNLQRAGVQALDWNVSDPFDQVIKRRLGPPPAFVRAVGARV